MEVCHYDVVIAQYILYTVGIRVIFILYLVTGSVVQSVVFTVEKVLHAGTYILLHK